MCRFCSPPLIRLALLGTFPGGEGFRADRVVRPYKDLLSIDQSLALDLRRMEVLAFTVFVGREMTAIIKIACGA